MIPLSKNKWTIGLRRAAPACCLLTLGFACAKWNNPIVGGSKQVQVAPLPVTTLLNPGLLPGLGGVPNGTYYLTSNLGVTYNGGNPDGNSIFRINSDGTTDATFDKGAPSGFDNPAAVTLQELNAQGKPTGSLLVGGNSTAHYGGVSVPNNLIRLQSDGTWDPTYNAGGTGPNLGLSYLIQEIGTTGHPTGSVYATGTFTFFNDSIHGSINQSGILRVLANGQLDTSFASLNSVTAGTSSGSGAGLAQELNTSSGLPTGRVFLGGFFNKYNGDTNTSQCLVRLNHDGSLDTSWNYGAGRGLSNCNKAAGRGVSFVATEYGLNGLPTGKLWVAGTFAGCSGGVGCGTYADAAGAHMIPNGLIRIMASDGSWDSSFNAGNDGIPTGTGISYALQELSSANALPTGAWIVAGSHTSYNGDSNARFLSRVTLNGGYDSNWGAGSASNQAYGNSFCNWITYNLNSNGLPSGKYIVNGDMHNYLGNVTPVGVIGITDSGGWDSAFNAGGAGWQAFGWGSSVLPQFQ